MTFSHNESDLTVLGYFDEEDPEDLIAKRVWFKTPIFGRRKHGDLKY